MKYAFIVPKIQKELFVGIPIRWKKTSVARIASSTKSLPGKSQRLNTFLILLRVRSAHLPVESLARQEHDFSINPRGPRLQRTQHQR
jgi:hypothetical protein